MNKSVPKNKTFKIISSINAALIFSVLLVNLFSLLAVKNVLKREIQDTAIDDKIMDYSDSSVTDTSVDDGIIWNMPPAQSTENSGQSNRPPVKLI
jgi:hypothetical protein